MKNSSILNFFQAIPQDDFSFRKSKEHTLPSKLSLQNQFSSVMENTDEDDFIPPRRQKGGMSKLFSVQQESQLSRKTPQFNSAMTLKTEKQQSSEKKKKSVPDQVEEEKVYFG